MEQRQMDVEQLRDLRNKVKKRNSLSASLKQTKAEINRIEAVIQQKEKVLNGTVKQKWEEINYIKNEKDSIVNFEKSNAAKAKRRRIIFCAVGVLVNLLVFALSIMFLVNEAETSWMKDPNGYGPVFLIIHIVLGLILCFFPTVLLFSKDK